MKEIKLTQGKFAIVDDENFEWLNKFKWHAHKGGDTFYAIAYDNKKQVFMHRLILNMGDANLVCDHKNFNGLDNRVENLRIATRNQNAWNTKSRKNSISKYLGVSINRRIVKGKEYAYWIAQIQKNKKLIVLGYFKSEAEAAIAYNNAAVVAHGEFANLNKV